MRPLTICFLAEACLRPYNEYQCVIPSANRACGSCRDTPMSKKRSGAGGVPCPCHSHSNIASANPVRGSCRGTNALCPYDENVASSCSRTRNVGLVGANGRDLYTPERRILGTPERRVREARGDGLVGAYRHTPLKLIPLHLRVREPGECLY